ncbi:unnamed protein product, partial [Cuscuta epithymum]
MQEFRVNDAQPGGTSTIKGVDGDNMKLEKCVLCKIYKNVDNSTREGARQNEDLELDTQHGQSIAPNNDDVTVTNSGQATDEDKSYDQPMPQNDRANDGGTSVYDVTVTNSDQTTNEDKRYDQTMPPNDRAIEEGTSVYDVTVTNSDQTTDEDKRYN